MTDDRVAPRSTVRPRAADYRLGLWLVTGSAVAWSLAGFFTRLIDRDVWTLLVWRGVFGAVGIAGVLLVTQRRGAWRAVRTMGWPAWLFAVLSAFAMIVYVTALRATTVAHVAVIYATVPFFAAALAWIFLGERPSRSAILASLAALIGVAVMVGFGREGTLWGDLLAVAMTALMASIMVVMRRLQDMPVMPAVCVAALLSGLVCWPLGNPLAVSGHDLLLLAAFGFVNSALGLALFTVGARLLPPVETALIGSLDAPLAPIWVWLAFAEAPSVSTVTGGVIVFAAVGLHIGLGAFGRAA